MSQQGKRASDVKSFATNQTKAVGRRKFVGQTATVTAMAMTAKSYAQIAGANERVNLGLFGFGLIGRVHARSFTGLDDTRLVAVSDAYKPRMDACREFAQNVEQYPDFRSVLDNKSIDAVIVATPDHWHALHTMMACAAGKDVYVEKPTHLFVREGEWMQQVASKHNRVVQVGTQQRSGPHYSRAKELLRSGAIGEITSVQCDFFRNVMPGIGSPADTKPAADFDWSMFVGPTVLHPYNPNRGIYHFRWFWDSSGGQMTNLGHHSLDIVQWVFDIEAPKAVSSHGGRWFLKDNAETPDTQNTIIEYDKFPAIVQIREAAFGARDPGSGGLVFVGTKGTMRLSRAGYEILADRKIDPRNSFAGVIRSNPDSGHPIGGPQPVDEPNGQTWCTPHSDKTGDVAQQYRLHARNFIDCIKSRHTPHSDLRSSHWVSTTCHLANISLKTQRKVVWDSAANDIPGDEEASRMLERAYREPWASELKGLLS